MVKSLKTMVLLAIVILMSSFSKMDVHQFAGTYGVSVNNPSQIRLTINADHTFYYQDFSIANQKIEVKGFWTLRGNKVVLNDNGTDVKFHNVWTFDKNAQLTRSRKGLTFYSLCKVVN